MAARGRPDTLEVHEQALRQLGVDGQKFNDA